MAGLLGTDPLTTFLRAAAVRPFSWGTWDCLTWLAAWVEETKGVDPALPWRGRYDSALGAARIVKEAGGMDRLLDQALLPLGFVRGEAERGDIAVITVPPEARVDEQFDGQLGAIMLGGSAVNMNRGGGLSVLPVRMVPVTAAWRIA